MTTTVRMTSRPLVGITVLALSWGGLAGAGGCAKKDDAGKASAVPPLAGPAQPAEPAQAPPTAPAMPPAPPAPGSAGTSAPDPGATISGRIVVGGALGKPVPKGTLYLVARRLSDNPSARGTLIAVKKLAATYFPLPFTLSAADMPFQNGPFDGELS